MIRYIGPKNRLSRRENLDLFGKGPKLRRAEVKPGQHGYKRNRPPSIYGRQLREKQKIKRLYGITERQMVNYYKEAARSVGNSIEALASLLERRLDNVVFRLNFAPTRPMARQLVAHQHIIVNDKRLSVPSYEVKVDDIVALDSKAMNIPAVKDLVSQKPANLQDWLNRSGGQGKILRMPVLKDIPEPVDLNLVIESYSR